MLGGSLWKFTSRGATLFPDAEVHAMVAWADRCAIIQEGDTVLILEEPDLCTKRVRVLHTRSCKVWSMYETWFDGTSQRAVRITT